MNIEEIDALRSHLDVFSETINNFCKRSGFELIPIQAIGRYPRIRIQRVTDIAIWIDLWMGLDENGKRYNKFFMEIPYELSAGASFIENSEDISQIRHQHSFLIWRKPFSDVLTCLNQDLETAFKTLLQFDRDFLILNGVKISF